MKNKNKETKNIIEIQKSLASLKHCVNERINKLQSEIEEVKDAKSRQERTRREEWNIARE